MDMPDDADKQRHNGESHDQSGYQSTVLRYRRHGRPIISLIDHGGRLPRSVERRTHYAHLRPPDVDVGLRLRAMTATRHSFPDESPLNRDPVD
jgi:hypothetical protein